MSFPTISLYIKLYQLYRHVYLRKLDIWPKRGKRASIRCATMINTHSRQTPCEHPSHSAKSTPRTQSRWRHLTQPSSTSSATRKMKIWVVTSWKNIFTHLASLESVSESVSVYHRCSERKCRLPRNHAIAVLRWQRVNDLWENEWCLVVGGRIFTVWKLLYGNQKFDLHYWFDNNEQRRHSTYWCHWS